MANGSQILNIFLSAGLMNFSNALRNIFRGGSRTVATSKMECFVIIVNGLKPLTIIMKRFILDVAAVLDPALITARVMNIWIKCIPLINNIWKKKVFEIFSATKKYMDSLRVPTTTVYLWK